MIINQMIVSELNIRLYNKDFEAATKLAALLRSFLPPLDGKNHFISALDLVEADKLLKNQNVQGGIYSKVVVGMNCTKMVMESGKGFRSYRKEVTNDKPDVIKWIEVE